ncbi:hypothetical protein GGC64_005382 [Mycobacterium sp. OAS707]|uniref:hypothetical protein n=1 Tax=Mycobacterium sp. OAS707 TaxID=2663822 RepID=UPI001789D32C|nr:hypothetical protein [Mycobacterium sp. OAS707]MBE1551322.1 hypothetical protein [Mycobacterium sp. OAS707]
MAENEQSPFVPFVDEDGRVTGVMDQMTADYLSSTDPDPTQASLDAVFERVTRVRLIGYREVFAVEEYDGERYDARERVFDVVRLDVTDPESLTELVAALRIAEADVYGHVMSIGDHHLELWTGEQHVHTLEVIDWDTIRWSSVWKGDATLAYPRRFADWLLTYGIPDARDRCEEREQSMAERQRHVLNWVRAMPPSLLPLWPERLGDGRGRAPDLDAARLLLEAATPDPVGRVRALFAWFGSDSRPWNRYYDHEEVPEELLLEYPIDVLLAAAATDSESELLGAARLFTGFDSHRTRKADLEQCPEPLREQIRQAVQRQGIAENLKLFERAFDLSDG